MDCSKMRSTRWNDSSICESKFERWSESLFLRVGNFCIWRLQRDTRPVYRLTPPSGSTPLRETILTLNKGTSRAWERCLQGSVKGEFLHIFNTKIRIENTKMKMPHRKLWPNGSFDEMHAVSGNPWVFVKFPPWYSPKLNLKMNNSRNGSQK